MAVSTNTMRMFLSWSWALRSSQSQSHFLHLPKTSNNPSLFNSNILHLKSTYHVQIVVDDDEPEDRIVNRFKKAVLRAGVLQECRRRRFFLNKHDKIKMKSREASRRNRNRNKSRSQAQAQQNKNHSKKKNKKDDDDDDVDNWELPDVDIPYT